MLYLWLFLLPWQFSSVSEKDNIAEVNLDTSSWTV